MTPKDRTPEDLSPEDRAPEDRMSHESDTAESRSRELDGAESRSRELDGAESRSREFDAAESHSDDLIDFEPVVGEPFQMAEVDDTYTAATPDELPDDDTAVGDSTEHATSDAAAANRGGAGGAVAANTGTENTAATHGTADTVDAAASHKRSSGGSFWRGTGRAATGLGITAVAAAAVLVLQVAPLPGHSVTPPSVNVSTVNHGQRTLVCNGGFGWLGADTNRPNAVIPTGAASVVSFGGTASRAKPQDGGEAAAPTILTAGAEARFAAAQSQTLNEEELKGAAATSCSEPLSDQWLVGARTALGHSATLTVTNPGKRPATVNIVVFHEEGRAADANHAGLLVPAGQARSISLNGLAPARKAIIAHVQSTGTAVTATLSTSHMVDIYPQGIDVLTPQAAPNQRLVIPGLTSVQNTAATDAQTHEANTVRLLNTGDKKTTAVLTALRANGTNVKLGTVELPPNKVIDTELKNYPADGTALLVDADQPLVGSGLGHAMAEGKTDFAWFAAAPGLRDETAAAITPGGSLVLANPNEYETTVTLAAAENGKPQRITLPAYTAKAVPAPAAHTLITPTQGQPVYAAVRMSGDATLAAYPVLPLSERAESLTVYPKP